MIMQRWEGVVFSEGKTMPFIRMFPIFLFPVSAKKVRFRNKTNGYFADNVICYIKK